MLRWIMYLLAAVLMVTNALAADQVAVRKKRQVEQLPPGLPRPHYKYRTTIAPPEPPKVYVETDPDALISPAYGVGSYIRNLPGTPLLPGSYTLPGYYGRPWDYDYQGPYYGGPQVGYWWRLPYACGVYGYC
ncbi:hypothetical protein QA640_25745 [Bradyrhizobium sp. CB82]|uniref:hypothetical protein n=1 Tax=Bradyrhizobium sp. CB82 TaxID=3039159 RepID=UPI0024B144FE|nr:hypothetical protein [Bradyrhizobium sp. CB82]WFU37856.1 hypothetical protein QA640_25745 [Bradyrhizobium sp. CB82]